MSAAAAADDVVPDDVGPRADVVGALPWLELLEGTTRERLIERLAQAYLTGGLAPVSDPKASLRRS